jgi:hypothetical protein
MLTTAPRISKEHTAWKWQDSAKLNELDFIPGIKEDIRKALKTRTHYSTYDA